MFIIDSRFSQKPKAFPQHLLSTYSIMRTKLLLGFFLGVFVSGFGQTVKVIDKNTSEPLAGTVVSNQSIFLTTNVKGEIDISAFSGSELIKIQLIGYITRRLSYKKIEQLDFKIELEADGLSLDEVVISGTRWRQYSHHNPSTIISINSADVELQNPQTAADLLGISGKVFIQKSQQGGGSPMIRGFSTNRLIYTIDGVRINNAIFRGGNIQNVINIDPFAVEKTEVLFGPGSVIYGSDAIGGVMSFNTLTPEYSKTDKLKVHGNAAGRLSSANNELTGHADVNLGLKKWAFITSISSWDYDDLRQGSHGPDDYIKNTYPIRENGQDLVAVQDDELLQIPSAYSQFNFMQKASFKPSDNWKFNYGFHYSKTSSYGRYDRYNREIDGLPRHAEWDYGPQQWIMNNLNISYTNQTNLFDNLSIRLAHQWFEESRIVRNFNSDIRTTRVENVNAYSINLDFTKDLNKTHRLFYGVEYVLNDVNSNGTAFDITSENTSDAADRYPLSTWNSIAIYINDEWKATEKLSVQAGLRYNQFIIDADFSNNTDFFPFDFESAKINNGALTGSLGAVYRPKNNWELRMNFGTAFRSPNIDDIGKVFDSEPGAVVVPNPDLDAEYAYNIDFGIAKVFDNVLKIYTTAYYTLLDNALVRRDFQLDGQEFIDYDGVLSRVQALQNAARANVYGLQFGLEAKFLETFTFESDLNYQKGKEELDDGSTSASRHAAPFFGVSRLRYKYDNKLTVELNTIFQGEQSFENLAESERAKDEIYAKDENGNNYAPAWYTFNFKALYRLNKSISLSGGIENITNQRYRPYSSGISGAGLNFILSAGFTF
jgi:hemoglobin/transferrin/lactoferrin receptor protein